MAKDYAKSAQTALKLIKKFGVVGALLRNEGILIDVNSPWEGKTTTEISYPANIALVPINSKDKSLMSDSLADKTIATAYMDAVELTEIPEIGDSILHDSIKWQIESIEPLKPATVNIVWTMVVSQ